MAVVRITIKKTLTTGAYSYKHSASGPFSSEYLVRTDALFSSPILREYARQIAKAESRLYPACVSFDTAILKLATPGMNPEALRGQFSHVDMNKLRGEIALPEGEMLAFPSVIAVFGREAQWGRNGRLLMPHALTTTEWIQYTQKQTVPARYQRSINNGYTYFHHELLEAIRGANSSYVMSGTEVDTEESLRMIEGFFFLGFEVNARKTKRKKSSVAAKRVTPRSASTPVEGVVYMLQGQGYFKIGKSINSEKRLNQIKLQLPFPVEVVHIIRAANPSQVESYWHRRFATSRRNGEWFELTEAEVGEFKGVAEM